MCVMCSMACTPEMRHLSSSMRHVSSKALTRMERLLLPCTPVFYLPIEAPAWKVLDTTKDPRLSSSLFPFFDCPLQAAWPLAW